jgi:hypothetical protein
VARQQERHLSHGWPTGKAGGTELWPHEAELGREAKGRGEPEVDSTSGQERKEDNERGVERFRYRTMGHAVVTLSDDSSIPCRSSPSITASLS